VKNLQPEQRNLILAIALSLAILLGSQFLLPKQPAPPPQSAEQTSAQMVPGAPMAPGAPVIPGLANALAAKPREQVLASVAGRVRIDNGRLHGSLSPVGARVDDLTLAGYHETIDKSSPEVVLFAPAGSYSPYYAEFGWVPADSTVAVPGPDTVWQVVEGSKLTATTPVHLQWDNGQGLVFEQTVAIDENYMLTVSRKVTNSGDGAVTLYPYGIISRHGTPKTENFYILHEGPYGVFDGTLKEFKYSKLAESDVQQFKTTGGWLGITDKYWLAALVPDQTEPVDARIAHSLVNGQDRYQTDFRGEAKAVAPGGSVETTSHLFAGAKQVKLIQQYEETLGIQKFDLAVDFGWFYFLTKPLFFVIVWLNSIVGNFGIAIILLTMMVRTLMFPLAHTSYKAMSKMKKLAPEMQKLRDRFKDDRAGMQQELMQLYKREKVNPMAGCLPIAVQIPVFFALYKVLFISIEMRHAPFYGWIHDLSAADPTNLFTLFGLISWSPPEMLHLGVWPILMGITMFLQQKLNPPPPDPVQARIFQFLPIIFTFMLGRFPAGLVIYWTVNNTLSITQQYLIMRSMGVPVGAAAAPTPAPATPPAKKGKTG
jgi:YidC/Oxa1 family membrane protein insertase